MTVDGLERLRRWRDEGRGVPPAVTRLGATLERMEPAATAVRLPLSPELLLPGGEATCAVAALLADFGLTTSIMASLPDPRGVTTIAMTVDHLCVPPVGGWLLATCRAAPYDGARPQHATGVLHDADGCEIARATGWFLPTAAEPDRVERVHVVRERPAEHLLDLLAIEPGPSFVLVAREALGNVLGSLHGGVGALAGSLAAEAALGRPLRPLTAAFTYLRPTPRHASVTVTGSVVRAGRRTGISTAVAVDAAGRTTLQTTLVAARSGA